MLEFSEYLKVMTAACGAMVLTFASLVAVSQPAVTTGIAFAHVAAAPASV